MVIPSPPHLLSDGGDELAQIVAQAVAQARPFHKERRRFRLLTRRLEEAKEAHPESAEALGACLTMSPSDLVVPVVDDFLAGLTVPQLSSPAVTGLPIPGAALSQLEFHLAQTHAATPGYILLMRDQNSLGEAVFEPSSGRFSKVLPGPGSLAQCLQPIEPEEIMLSGELGLYRTVNLTSGARERTANGKGMSWRAHEAFRRDYTLLDFDYSHRVWDLLTVLPLQVQAIIATGGRWGHALVPSAEFEPWRDVLALLGADPQVFGAGSLGRCAGGFREATGRTQQLLYQADPAMPRRTLWPDSPAQEATATLKRLLTLAQEHGMEAKTQAFQAANAERRALLNQLKIRDKRRVSVAPDHRKAAASTVIPEPTARGPHDGQYQRQELCGEADRLMLLAHRLGMTFSPEQMVGVLQEACGLAEADLKGIVETFTPYACASWASTAEDFALYGLGNHRCEDEFLSLDPEGRALRCRRRLHENLLSEVAFSRAVFRRAGLTASQATEFQVRFWERARGNEDQDLEGILVASLQQALGLPATLSFAAARAAGHEVAAVGLRLIEAEATNHDPRGRSFGVRLYAMLNAVNIATTGQVVAEIQDDTPRLYEKYSEPQKCASTKLKAQVLGSVLHLAKLRGSALAWTRAELQAELSTRWRHKSATALRSRVERALAELVRDGLVCRQAAGARNTACWGFTSSFQMDLAWLLDGDAATPRDLRKQVPRKEETLATLSVSQAQDQAGNLAPLEPHTEDPSMKAAKLITAEGTALTIGAQVKTEGPGVKVLGDDDPKLSPEFQSLSLEKKDQAKPPALPQTPARRSPKTKAGKLASAAGGCVDPERRVAKNFGGDGPSRVPSEKRDGDHEAPACAGRALKRHRPGLHELSCEVENGTPRLAVVAQRGKNEGLAIIPAVPELQMMVGMLALCRSAKGILYWRLRGLVELPDQVDRFVVVQTWLPLHGFPRACTEVQTRRLEPGDELFDLADTLGGGKPPPGEVDLRG